MADIKRLFFELKLEVFKIALLKALLNAVLFFLVLNISFLLFNVKFFYGIIISAIFLAVNTYLNYASVTLKKIEDQNPEVREMLRTVKDNIDQDNIMVNALKLEVLKKARNIYSGNIIKYKHLIIKIFFIGVLTISTIFITTLNLKIGEIKNPLDFNFGKGSFGLDIPPDLSDTELINADDIYGDARIAKLGNEIINLNINPSMSELDLNKLKDEEDISLSSYSFPVETGQPQGAAVSGEKKPEESELVNAYYLKKIKK